MSELEQPSTADGARAALKRHAWSEAFEILAAADAAGTLAPDELELLAQSAFWVGKLPVAIEARERAYALAVKAGRPDLAAVAAISLGRDNLWRNSHSVGNAWLNKAERILQGVEEGIAHGWLAAMRSFHAALVGDSERALAEASRALDIARRISSPDLEAIALSQKGAALVAAGQVAEGLALADEATVAALGGELEADTAGGVYCTNIEACTALGDWGRAAEWTEAQDRWCRREGINGYPGMCRVFRSEIKRMRGSWLEAEAEARQATVELQGFIPAAVGSAFYQIAEIRRRQGDLSVAEDALERAHALGTDPEPALSLVRLADGQAAAAFRSITRVLEEPTKMPSWRAPPDSALHRIPYLSALVEIALAAGEVPPARAAADELVSYTERFATPMVRAAAATASGAVRIAEGDRDGGARDLRRAVEAWAEVDAPYEGARSRMMLAEAYAADGDPDRAIGEIRAATATFERLGAALDLRRAEEVLAVLDGGPVAQRAGMAAERNVRTFIFTDIIDSTKLAELLGDEAWGRLLGWHDQALRAVVAEHGGEVIKATGDGFFLAFTLPDRAIEAAIGMQRRLADHRRDEGFSPAIRIGVHQAEASRSGLDYIGTGVNQAARICAAASGAEILVSAATLDATRRTYPASGRRMLELRGIATPVEVAAIAWG